MADETKSEAGGLQQLLDLTRVDLNALRVRPAHLVERVVSVLSGAVLLGREDLLKLAPSVEGWKVDDVALRSVVVSRRDVEELAPAVREEEVAVYSGDTLCRVAPLQTLTWFRPQMPAQAPIRIEGPSGATVQLWLSLVFKYDPVETES